MKTATIIQARMRSERLPGKVLLPVVGKPLLELMIERLRRVSALDQIIIATTRDPSCDPIEALAERLGVGCFRGSEEDVLDRVLQAARTFQVDVIVEATGDCPLIDPETVTRVIDAYRAERVDYCSNTLQRTFPRGMDVQVFARAVLEEVARLTDDPVDHEHVSMYMYEHPERFTLRNVESHLPAEAAQLRLTVDTPEDFTLIKTLYERLYPSHPHFALPDILALLAREPQLASMNRHIMQKIPRQAAAS